MRVDNEIFSTVDRKYIIIPRNVLRRYMGISQNNSEERILEADLGILEAGLGILKVGILEVGIPEIGITEVGILEVAGISRNA